jgi:hypothetical protein
MEIYIDQRIELITIIQTLCKYWDNLAQNFYNKKLFQCKYKENITQYFEKYQQNKILSLYNNLCNDEQDISAFLTLILNYSQPPELNKVFNHNENKYEYFIENVKKFYAEANINYFFENNKNEYEKILNDFGNKENILKDIGSIFNYFDIDKKIYKIIISPLIIGNFGISIGTDNYILISPLEYKENKYIFGSNESIRNIIWHEISHTVINNLTKKYFNHSKYENVEKSNIKVSNLYNNMETIINEYITRSITYFLEKDKNCAKALLDYEIKSGFNKIEEIKEYIIKNCTKNNKFIKDKKYIGLIDYVIKNKI